MVRSMVVAPALPMIFVEAHEAVVVGGHLGDVAGDQAST